MIYIIFGIIALISYVVQINLRNKMQRYGKVQLPNGMTGSDVAMRMLAQNGLSNVRVTQVNGYLTDHYNPANHTVNLSKEIYYGNSVAAAAVAATLLP